MMAELRESVRAGLKAVAKADRSVAELAQRLVELMAAAWGESKVGKMVDC